MDLAQFDGKILFSGAAALLLTICLFFFFGRDSEKAENINVLIPEECQLTWEGEILENPSIKISGSNKIQCYCPATGELLGNVTPTTPEGIDRAIFKAQEAQEIWSTTKFSTRRKVLRTILKYILDNQDSIATAACRDSGKTRIDASFGEILVTAEKIKWTLDHGESSLAPEWRPTNFLMFYKKNKVIYEPLGVIAACVSWNYPFHNLMGPIISALFTGNSIIVKGSEQTAWSSNYFITIARASLSACGHNPDIVQSVICWPDTAEYLISHPDISHLTFIGSQSIAQKVAKTASQTLLPLCLELGGKDAAIILDDILDIDRVVATMIRGTFQASGQNCIGIERIICLPKIYPQIVERLKVIIEKLRVGSALNNSDVDVGACISDSGFDRLEKLIRGAVKQGAKLIVGGKRFVNPDFPKGHYFSPTLLIDVTASMEIAQTELFAPVCVVMKASTVDEAIAIANSTDYGLGSSVFGSSKRDLRRITKQIKAGMVAVNDFAVFYMVQLPFGGTKGSGYGRFAAKEGLRGLCNLKSVCEDRWPWIIKTTIPGPLQLPIKIEEQGWNMSKGIVEIGYGDTLKRRARGIGRMMGI